MRKMLAAILAAVVCLLAGCGGTGMPNSLLPGTEGITGITVSTMPQGYTAAFTGEKAAELAEYILHMGVQTDFSEDPNVHTGMTWVFEAAYEDGNTVTVYLFGNLFIRAEEGPWQKVSPKEAQGLEDLLKELQ